MYLQFTYTWCNREGREGYGNIRERGRRLKGGKNGECKRKRTIKREEKGWREEGECKRKNSQKGGKGSVTGKQ